MIHPVTMLGWLIGFLIVFLMGLVAGQSIVYSFIVPRMTHAWMEHKRYLRKAAALDDKREDDTDALINSQFWFGKYRALAEIFDSLFTFRDAEVHVRRHERENEGTTRHDDSEYAEFTAPTSS